MKVYRFLTLLIVAGLALVAQAQRDPVLSVRDDARNQTITVSVISNDIVRVDVVPDHWTAERLPSLALEQSLNEGDAVVLTNNLGDDMGVMTTASGLRVVLDKRLKSVTISNGTTLYTTDLCDRTLHGKLRLLHQGEESFYGAGERLLKSKRR